jgi:hypothetical protein
MEEINCKKIIEFFTAPLNAVRHEILVARMSIRVENIEYNLNPVGMTWWTTSD